MSYILDALQRADAERERGHVPGLQSQRVPPGGARRKPSAARYSRRARVALFAGLALLGASANRWWASDTTVPAPQTVSTPSLSMPAPPQPVARVPEPTPTAPHPRILAPARQPLASPATAVKSSQTAVPSIDELTPEARARLPAVHVSGSTYSQDPALRTLIANRKVLQEGQDIAPGLRLERIGPRTAVLDHQGMRFSIDH